MFCCVAPISAVSTSHYIKKNGKKKKCDKVKQIMWQRKKSYIFVVIYITRLQKNETVVGMLLGIVSQCLIFFSASMFLRYFSPSVSVLTGRRSMSSTRSKPVGRHQ